jgi:DNA (cytosine-5)-methyltransferase 1
MKPTGKGFFCGAGLMLIGLERAGLEVVESNELDPTCCATLRRNFRHKVNHVDITKKLVNDGSADADFYVFTYPCNKYSPIAAVHRKRTGDELFLHALRHMALRPPEAFICENVPGMKKFPVVMEVMTQLPDYYVTVFCPVKAEMWVPQRRDRLIIIGTRRPFTVRAPESKAKPATLRSILEKDPEIHIPDYVYNRLTRRGEYRDAPIISDPARGDIAPTCVAHYSKDKGTRLVADRRFKHGVRPYTPREYARLQGVPDSFTFAGGLCAQYKQIGNGVEVNMAEWAGLNLARYFKQNRRAA